MPANVEVVIFRTPVPPAGTNTESRMVMLTSPEAAVLDDSPDRLAAAVFNYGSDAIEVVTPAGPRRLDALTGDMIFDTGPGELSVQLASGNDQD